MRTLEDISVEGFQVTLPEEILIIRIFGDAILRANKKCIDSRYSIDYILKKEALDWIWSNSIDERSAIWWESLLGNKELRLVENARKKTKEWNKEGRCIHWDRCRNKWCTRCNGFKTKNLGV